MIGYAEERVDNMMRFSEISPDDFHDVQTIFNENLAYARLENRKLPLTRQAFTEEFLNPETISYMYRDETGPIAIIDYLPRHPVDHSTWIGLFIVVARYHHQGIGTAIYQEFHQHCLKNEPVIRLAVLPNNPIGRLFWERVGFTFERMSTSNTKQVVEVFVKRQDD